MVAPVVAMTVWRSLPLLRKFVFGIAFTVFFMGFLFTGVGSGFTGSQQGVQSGEKLTSGNGDEVESTGDCAAIASTARSQFRVLEENPPHGNRGPQVNEYTDDNPEQWCADFASWVYWRSGNKLNPSGTGGVAYSTDKQAGRENNVLNMQSYFSSREIGLPRGSDVQPGDMIFYRWRSGGTHMGVIVDYDKSQRIATTIEGNTGAGLEAGQEGVGTRRVSVDYASIIGFGRLKNCAESTP
jgi:hypothetical protein